MLRSRGWGGVVGGVGWGGGRGRVSDLGTQGQGGCCEDLSSTKDSIC